MKGYAGTGLRGSHEVMLVVDRSISAWHPSGVDVDGDGRVGRLRPGPYPAEEHPFWTTDAGDTIFQAELLAARRLIGRMNPETTRMGLVSFGQSAELRARLGSSPEELERAIDGLPGRGDPGGTHFAAAIDRALDELLATDPPLPPGEASDPTPRHRAIVFLSDGAPNLPPGARNTAFFTLLRAERARREGVRLFAFGLGPEAVRQTVFFEQMTGLTGGELFMVDEPGQVIEYLPHVSLTEIREIRVENRTSGQRARAVRQFPDGSFDAWVPLVPGPNALAIHARTASGAEQTIQRNVYFERRAPSSAEERAALQALLDELRARTLETELAARARQGLERVRRRNLRIDVLPGGLREAEDAIERESEAGEASP